MHIVWLCARFYVARVLCVVCVCGVRIQADIHTWLFMQRWHGWLLTNRELGIFFRDACRAGSPLQLWDLSVCSGADARESRVAYTMWQYCVATRIQFELHTCWFWHGIIYALLCSTDGGGGDGGTKCQSGEICVSVRLEYIERETHTAQTYFAMIVFPVAQIKCRQQQSNAIAELCR